MFMEEYVQMKNSMIDEVFQAINWEALGRCMNGMSISKQVKICKYMHHWQNIEFLHNWQRLIQRATKTRPHRYACTFGCGQVEKNQHYIRCNRSPKYTKKMQCLKSLREWMMQSKARLQSLCAL